MCVGGVVTHNLAQDPETTTSSQRRLGPISGYKLDESIDPYPNVEETIMREHEELTCREEPRKILAKIGKFGRKPLEKRILGWPKTVFIV